MLFQHTRTATAIGCYEAEMPLAPGCGAAASCHNSCALGQFFHLVQERDFSLVKLFDFAVVSPGVLLLQPIDWAL